MRIKIALLAVLLLVGLLVTTCDLLPPDIAIYMDLVNDNMGYDDITGYMTVSCDIENLGSYDLTNVEGYFYVEHSEGNGYYWSDGIDLDVGEVLDDYLIDIYILEEPNTVTTGNTEIVGWGCDNPPDD